MKKNRVFFIDNIKIVAAFFVILIHFRINLQGKIPIESFTPKVSLFFAIIYESFLICVPLFIISSGFLSISYTYSKKLLSSTLNIITIYILCSLSTYFILYFTKGVSFSVSEVVQKLMLFQLNPYSWYVEMFLGLLFIIPLINKAIINSTKKELSRFIILLILCIGLPTFINAIPQFQNKIHFPNYWKAFYPITYYLIGSYFKLHTDFSKLSKNTLRLLIFTLFGSIFIGSMINYLNATPFVGGFEGGYGSLLVTIQAVTAFALMAFYLDKPIIWQNKISNATLSIYLLSYAVDQLIYPLFLNRLANPKYLIFFFPILPIIIFIISIILALIINKINSFLWIHFKKLNI
nr:acyltransferase family protein [Vagococcus fluvialis]